MLVRKSGYVNCALTPDGCGLEQVPGLKNLVSNRKEENVLFNDALNTFYLRLYGVGLYGYMVKDHSNSERREETHCCHMGYSFRLAARVLLYASSHSLLPL